MVEIENDLISVLMCVYNTPVNYLKEAVESVLTQSYRNIQLIIVDDCSNRQETVQYLNEILQSDARVELIKNTENVGLTKSLNVGLRRCKGKYIARLDSDDIAYPNRLKIQKEYMDIHEEICLLGTHVICFGNGEKVDSRYQYYRQDDMEIRHIRLLFENVGVAHSTFMLRNSFLKEHAIAYREDLRYAQDYGMTVDCLLNGGEIYELPESLVGYRVHDHQISAASYKGQVECQAQTAYRYLSSVFKTLSEEELITIVRLNHERQDHSPSVHIRALRKLMRENKERQLYPVSKFNLEFRYEWYRKMMRITRINHKPWGIFQLFSIACIPSVCIAKWQNYMGRKRAVKH